MVAWQRKGSSSDDEASGADLSRAAADGNAGVAGGDFDPLVWLCCGYRDGYMKQGCSARLGEEENVSRSSSGS